MRLLLAVAAWGLALALVVVPASADAQDAGLGAWWRQSFGYTMPATVRPEPYSLELAARGIGCQTAQRQPEWALAEAIGRAVISRYRDLGTLPGQSIGTWREDLDSAHNNAVTRYLSCQIANRGTAPDSAFYVTHGARSFPDDALRLIAGLAPGGGTDAGAIEQARRDGGAAMKARAMAAIEGL